MLKHWMKHVVAVVVSACLMANGIGAYQEYMHASNANTIQGLTLNNTTMDLFDYWVKSEEGNDKNLGSDWRDVGINQNHDLKFIPYRGDMGARSESINCWTGKYPEGNSVHGKPFVGMVEPYLQDGYPVLKEGLKKDANAYTTRQSIAYLFNDQEVSGKRVYKNVKNLLTLNEREYYGYDSSKNFAEFDKASNSFVLYSEPRVGADGGVADKHMGQFFPFAKFNELNNVVSTAENINHHLGLHMKTHFMQPAGGVTSNGEAMKFNFSGDDDVWVFIDGVLVGDLGGIHERLILSIDFKEGKVVVEQGASYKNESGRDFSYETKFQDIAGLDLVNGRFADGSYHTLDFFFLERGHCNSNMKLETNLVSVPRNELEKVDQSGCEVNGARFELRQVQSDYQSVVEGGIVASGVSTHGIMSFEHANGLPIDFTKEYTKGAQYYVLKEVETPSGYRGIPPIHLRYDPTLRMLVCENTSETGAVCKGSVLVSAPSKICIGNQQEANLQEGGNVFAVVLKRSKNIGSVPSDSDGWQAISGDVVHGYRYKEIVNLEDVLAEDVEKHYFSKSEEGKFQLVVPELPGELAKYYHNASDSEKANCVYTLGYYYVDAQGSLHRVFADDTKHRFERRFGSRVIATNIKNEFYVQKVDDDLRPLNGVRFGLYPEAAFDAQGNLLPNSDAMMLEQATTKSCTLQQDGIDLEGGIVFGRTATLAMGTYYVVELDTLTGYAKYNQAIQVIVDEHGPHIDAGSKEDGVDVLVGAGTLMDAMEEYGSSINGKKTLKDIVVTLQKGKVNQQQLQWNPTNQNIYASYKDRGNGLVVYESKDGKNHFEVKEGFGWATIRQDYSSTEQKEDWSKKDLTSLFTQESIVRVRNQRLSKLTIEKLVTKPSDYVYPQGNKRPFTVQVQLTPKQGSTLKDQYTIRYYEYDKKHPNQPKVSKKQVNVVNGKLQVNVAEQDYFEILDLEVGVQYEISVVDGTLPFEVDHVYKEKKELEDDFSVNKNNHAFGKIVLGTDQEGQKVVIHSNYDPKSISIPIQKQFVTKDGIDAWDPQSAFTFKLSTDKKNPMPKGAQVVVDGTQYYTTKVIRDAQVVSFENIRFNDLGTYTYYVSEVIPKDQKNIEYSTKVYTVVVTVSDKNRDGTYELTYQIKDGNTHEKNTVAMFKNIAKQTPPTNPQQPQEPNENQPPKEETLDEPKEEEQNKEEHVDTSDSTQLLLHLMLLAVADLSLIILLYGCKVKR